MATKAKRAKPGRKDVKRAVNPATGEVVREYENHTPNEVRERVARAHEAFLAWSRKPLAERAGVLRRAADLLEDREERLARLMAEEMGKPFAEGKQEVAKCAWACRHYADAAAGYLADEPVETHGQSAGQSAGQRAGERADECAFVCYRPLGVVLAIMPWNFPFWQVFRFAAPALMAGNGALLKHASSVPACALAIEELLDEAGCPAGLLTNLFVEEDETTRLLEDPRVAAATVTGSVSAGAAIAAKAGAHVKKTVLELGGSDAYVVLEDADLEHAADTCVASRMINGGQSCIAAKRFIVVRSAGDELERLVVDRMRRIRMGPPLEEGVELGPLAREDLRDELHRQVTASVERGARLLTGGRVPEGPGWFYPPTVLGGVCAGMPAWDEELFGPVASITVVEDERDAIRAANDTRFGLGAAVFTTDLRRGERIAREELQAGSCSVNDLVRSDPRLPFGGIKSSGYGRELGAHGIREFTNVKTIRLARP